MVEWTTAMTAHYTCRQSQKQARPEPHTRLRILFMLVLSLISMSNQQIRIRGRKGYGRPGRERNKNEKVRRVNWLNNLSMGRHKGQVFLLRIQYSSMQRWAENLKTKQVHFI